VFSLIILLPLKLNIFIFPLSAENLQFSRQEARMNALPASPSKRLSLLLIFIIIQQPFYTMQI
jgi:hypothetical protein